MTPDRLPGAPESRGGVASGKGGESPGLAGGVEGEEGGGGGRAGKGGKQHRPSLGRFLPAAKPTGLVEADSSLSSSPLTNEQSTNKHGIICIVWAINLS